MFERYIPDFFKRNKWENTEVAENKWIPLSIQETDMQVHRMLNETANTEIKEEEKPLTEIKNDTTEKVDKLLVNSKVDKVRYFLKEFFRKELWIEITIESPSYSKDNISVATKLNLKASETIEKVILKIISEEWLKIEQEKIIIWDIKITIEEDFDKWVKFVINVWNANDKDLVKLKEIVQKYLLPKCESKNNTLSWQQVVEILWIDRDIYRSWSDNQFRLVYPIESKIKLDNKVLAYISSRISTYDNKYFIKLADERYFSEEISLSVIEPSKWFAMFDISIKSANKELEIKVKSSYTHITKEFLEIFFKNFSIEILKLQEWWVNHQKQLEDLWVKVIIPNKEENSKTIEEISIEEWFVWYSDIKEEIDTKIISPWKQKAKYEELWAELFPQIKWIIPNYAIFEWEPGTGKTTEWKIIWRYLWFPFIYIPINSITSKWYWESEERLNDIFEISWKLAKEHWWAVLMIDEIDEIWWNRNNSHEATWRVTWVLLKKLDWIERVENILLLASTNRIDKLDPALVSRSNLNLNFRKPTLEDIKLMLPYYIKWLWEISNELLEKLEWKSGRDISNLAKFFASHMIKKFSVEELKKDWFIANEFVNFLEKK